VDNSVRSLPELCVKSDYPIGSLDVWADDRGPYALVSASSVDKGAKTDGGNVEAAKTMGKLVAERAREKGIKAVVFDRGGYQYHGRVKALADAARAAGLEF